MLFLFKGEIMKLLILLALLVSCACTNMKTKPMLTLETPSLELNDQGIPVDCYDAEGKFDENRGHDYLDCDNLDNRVQF